MILFKKLGFRIYLVAIFLVVASQTTGALANCPPGFDCVSQQIHAGLRSAGNITCVDGLYCPGGPPPLVLFCEKGRLCRTPSLNETCPSGSYCPFPSFEPTGCPSFSLDDCPAGSQKSHPLTPFVIFFILLSSGAIGVAVAMKQVPASRSDLPIFVKSVGELPNPHKMDIRFKDLMLSVNLNGTSKHVLQGISGEFKAGVVTAVMGPSGAGKTTLLSVLLGKNSASNKGSCGGSIFINGKEDLLAKHAAHVGVVPQEDTMLRALTVHEVLKFSALTRLPDSLSRRQKLTAVEDALRTLGLEHVKHSVIGDERTRGISGGERKRVSIGMELVSSPSVLFLDEPTSGLDATSAKSVVECLHRIAKQGKTVVAVIHQPRYEIFKLFDSVLLLAKGGRTAYFGPASDCKAHFESIGYPCPPRCNPSDFFMDVVSGRISPVAIGGVGSERAIVSDSPSWVNVLDGIPSQSLDDLATFSPQSFLPSTLALSKNKQEGARAVDSVVASWKSKEEAVLGSITQEDLQSCGDISPAQQPSPLSLFLAFLQLFAVQDYREADSVLRDTILQLLPGAILGGLSFKNEIFGPPVPQQIVDICPAIIRHRCEHESVTTMSLLANLFFTVMTTSAANANKGTQSFSRFPEVLRRQTRSMDTKSLFVFYFAKITFDLWSIARSSFGWLVFYYFFLGPRGSFGDWYAVMFSFAFASYGLGYLVSFLTDPDKAAVVATVCGIAWSVTSGLSPTLTQVARLAALQIFWWLSFTRWASEAIVLLFTQGYPVHYRVDSYLRAFGFDPNGWSLAVGLTFAIGVGYRIIAFLLMLSKHKRSKL